MRAEGSIEAGGLSHPALQDNPASVPLREARWSDRQKLAALLQASALLAHLEHAGLHLPGGFRGARAGAEGRLLVSGIAPGRSPRPAQDLLLDLLGTLFGTASGIPGKGEARRAARTLLDAWRQPFAPLSPDTAVAQVLEAAPFLWEAGFGPAREALAARHGSEISVAGPGPGRTRLLARSRDLAELRALLASPAARALWEGEDPDSQPAAPEERLETAARLASRGRFARARAELAGLRSAAAAVLRLRCLYQLGELGAVRDGLRRLAATPLSPEAALDAAEVAVRVFANGGEPERARGWVEGALAAASVATADRGSPLLARAHLLSAEAAWDRGDQAAVARHLEAASPALDEPALAWRWHQVKGLAALAAGEAEAVVTSLGNAISASRRHLSRPEAAGLWNDLGIGRVGVGDLPGAERAFRHSVRLLAGCDGPRRTTLALANLAEVRLRRGETSEVREILERSTAENRLARNLRGLAHDAELWARLELVLGRPGAALALCREALRELDTAGLDWRRAELHTLAARALGWLGRSEEAAAALAETTPSSRAELEPEERPALFAHAGEREAALREAAGTPLSLLWIAALTGEAPEPAAWGALQAIDAYRAARLTFDLEILAPGTVPADRRRTAVAVLRRAGAGLLAERLEAREEGPWRALAEHLERPPGEPESWAALLRAAGYSGVSLTLDTGSGERVLVAGDEGGGQAKLAADVGDGRLTLWAPAVDLPLRALFALVRRELPVIAEPRPAAPAVRAGGMIGESPALRETLARLALLAPRDLTVLVLGETGTGKELAARLVHRGSPRASGPFVAVNCAALSESLLLSDLFGHVRGAFTGADKDRAGVFETAQRGTVFLDEIGDLPAVAQGMLLRVLQEREVRRVGESLPRKIDVRVVAATHRDLAAAVAAGIFREDLYYRLKGGSVELPPLRERKGDILLLAEHFLARQRGPGFIPSLSRRAAERLLAHSFPGNVRELENLLAMAAALAGGGAIEPEHLGLPEAPGGEAMADPRGYHQRLFDYRRELLIDELVACGGNQAEAARRLGLSRQGFSYLSRQLRLP